jgi:hypothetical protein
MSGHFPQAVIFDSRKEHHVVVGVSHPDGLVTVACSDCLSIYQVPLHKLEWLRQMLSADSDTQVIQWVEYND